MLLIMKKKIWRIGVSVENELKCPAICEQKISHNEMLYSHLNVRYESIKIENNILKSKIVECSFS